MSNLLLLASAKASTPATNKTLLLMHFDGNFLDASNHNTGITSSGNIGSNGKFGGYATFVSQQICTIPANSKNATATAGTVEAWIYKTGTITWGCLLMQGSASGNFSGLDFSNGSGYDMALVGYTGSAQQVAKLINTGAIPLNQWVHVAATWDGSTATGWLNGVKQLSAPLAYWPFNRPTMPMYVGNIVYAPGYPFVGNIDDLRLSNVVRYTANFTPPTSAFVVD